MSGVRRQQRPPFRPGPTIFCRSVQPGLPLAQNLFQTSISKASLVLQTETHLDPSLNSTQSTPHYFPDSFQAAPFCVSQSLTPGSPSDSSTLSGSFDYSYSPAQLPSHAPENYSSPPSLDPRTCGYPSEDYSYPHVPPYAPYDCFSSAGTSVCYCASCEAEHLDTIRASEYLSYPSSDYVTFAPSAAATSDFYKRGTNCDICYS